MTFPRRSSSRSFDNFNVNAGLNYKLTKSLTRRRSIAYLHYEPIERDTFGLEHTTMPTWLELQSTTLGITPLDGKS